MSQTMQRLGIESRKLSKEEVTTSMEDSQMLSVTKINFIKNVTQGGKLTTLSNHMEDNMRSLVQTELIEGDSKRNLSHLQSDE